MEGATRKNARIRRMRDRQREGRERSCMSRKGPIARTILEVCKYDGPVRLRDDQAKAIQAFFRRSAVYIDR